ncbi:protocadherin beta-15-like [Phaenicophaeus curvirostris]|uniref:protocadherin beta-15-like n=1 Tax=Phaenicophaeus curvirostris TaxID=33595 RepID=UPI0037F0F02F
MNKWRRGGTSPQSVLWKWRILHCPLRGKPRAADEELAFRSRAVLPRAALCLRGGSCFLAKRERSHCAFWLRLGTGSAASSSKGRAGGSAAAEQQRKYSPVRRWVGVLAANRRVPVPAPALQAAAERKSRGSRSGRAAAHGVGELGGFQAPQPGIADQIRLGRGWTMLGTTEDGEWLLWRVRASGRRNGERQRRVILLLVCVCVCQSGAEPLRYSLAEEMERESFVGNIAEDLGLSPSQLAARKARVVSEGNERLFHLNRNTGALTAKESLDREEMCPQSDTCTVFFKIVFENPLELIRGEVEIRDINDNSPVFPEKEVVLEVLETTSPGSRFPLQNARDKDVGSNGLQNYSLGSNSHFSLHVGTEKGVELVLDRQLDREEQPQLNLILTASDGGSPPRSGTAHVQIVVLDSNDNTPVFSREVYEVQLAENSPPGQLVVRVAAADPDEGSYGKVRYRFSQISERSQELFQLNPDTGEIQVVGNVDFEEAKHHKMVVRATDGGGLSAHCKVRVEVLDVNDNAPEITLTSQLVSVPEDAPPRTVVALLSVRDRDSGDNGRTECSIDGDSPFMLTGGGDEYYELRTTAALDRERAAEYNVTVRAADRGRRRLSSRASLRVQVSDVNDNAPEFTQAVYTASVSENEGPMVRIGSVSATDADAGANGRVRYALVRQEGAEQPAVSVNAESGAVFLLRPLDYEQVRALEVAVRAADGGSPPLSAQAVLRVVVRDENDNAPVVLHPPAESSGAAAGELVPRSAEAGYLVAKVVAVDADAGQNAWLSYELWKATEPGLFRVGPHSGEVRTARAVAERDAPRHRLVVLVRDRGRPPRSATATLGIALVGGFSDAHLRGAEEAPAAEPEGPLTLSLTVCLACVSALFLATAGAAVAAKVRRARRSAAESLPAFPQSAPPSSAGSLPRSSVYDVCFAAGSLDGDLRFLGPLLPCFPAGLPPGPAEQRSSLCSTEAANLGDDGDRAAEVRDLPGPGRGGERGGSSAGGSGCRSHQVYQRKGGGQLHLDLVLKTIEVKEERGLTSRPPGSTSSVSGKRTVAFSVQQ